jgi:pimeloyl-ACP methyl ester carboxylesterase
MFSLAASLAVAQAPAQAPASTDRFATVNGLRLHYLEWGGAAKPAMILLHGIAKHAHTFDHIAVDLARDYHVLAVDMRGHGDSGWSPEGAYLVEDYVKDLEGLVRQLGIRRATLLGNSTGGRVVQVFAGMHPDLVERLASLARPLRSARRAFIGGCPVIHHPAGPPIAAACGTHILVVRTGEPAGPLEPETRTVGLGADWTDLDPWAADVAFSRSTDLLRRALAHAYERAEIAK